MRIVSAPILSDVPSHKVSAHGSDKIVSGLAKAGSKTTTLLTKSLSAYRRQAPEERRFDEVEKLFHFYYNIQAIY
jgi:hypothetical protein